MTNRSILIRLTANTNAKSKWNENVNVSDFQSVMEYKTFLLL